MAISYPSIEGHMRHMEEMMRRKEREMEAKFRYAQARMNDYGGYSDDPPKQAEAAKPATPKHLNPKLLLLKEQQ